MDGQIYLFWQTACGRPPVGRRTAVKSENHVTDFFNQICVYFRIDHLDYDSIIITIVVTYLVIREFFKLFSKFCKRFPYDFDGLL